MENTLKLVKQLEKRISLLDERMEYYDDIKHALQRSVTHLKMSLEALSGANNYPTHLCERKVKSFELYGQSYKVDYNLYTFEDGSHDTELNFVYDAVTGDEEKYLSKNIEEKLKQLILK